MNENLANEIRKTIESVKDMKIQVGGINNYLSILEGMIRADCQKQVDEAYQRGYNKGYADKTNNDEVCNELAKDIVEGIECAYGTCGTCGTKNEVTTDKFIDALDGVVWYNGLGEHVLKWKTYDQNSTEFIYPYRMYIHKEIDRSDYDQLLVIWMICVLLFGDYGTSPRTGWINDWDGFYEFIDKITATYREDEM